MASPSGSNLKHSLVLCPWLKSKQRPALVLNIFFSQARATRCTRNHKPGCSVTLATDCHTLDKTRFTRKSQASTHTYTHYTRKLAPSPRTHTRPTLHNRPRTDTPAQSHTFARKPALALPRGLLCGRWSLHTPDAYRTCCLWCNIDFANTARVFTNNQPVNQREMARASSAFACACVDGSAAFLI